MRLKMFTHPLLLSSLTPLPLAEILIVFTIASLAYFIVFNKFEKHVPMKRRITKLVIVVGILAVIGILFGRYAYWGMIALMTCGQIALHGWYFPKHGVNGLTAEPYDKYLELIKEMKGINNE
jgi:uncharacterized membrane protein